MRSIVGLFESVSGEVGVDLGGRKILMSKQFLYAAKVGSGIQQMSRITVPDFVWSE